MTAVFPHVAFDDYELLDSGALRKLERFGAVELSRPDPQALWRRRASDERWSRADWTFVRESDRGGHWARPGERDVARGREAQAIAPWTVAYGGARFEIEPTPFKHVGLFPEQATNWRLLEQARDELGARPRLLNLFGYTGAASVVAALNGFRVTHVDASKASLAWARRNAAASGLAPDAWRVVLEDAASFAVREARRGQRYAAILLDPPRYGRGPKGERWQLEEGLAGLLEACAVLLEERALLVLSTYAVGYSPLAFANVLGAIDDADVSVGELVLPERAAAPPPAAQRLLPCGFCARLARGFALDAAWRAGAPQDAAEHRRERRFLQ